MKNYKDYIILKGGNELGLLWCDIEEYLLTPAEFRRFQKYMKGQTMGVLGKIENGDFMSIVYVRDFERFIKNLPVID